MKIIIWIIVALLVIWGLWKWLGNRNDTTATDNTNYSGVTASSTNTLEDLGTDLDSKG